MTMFMDVPSIEGGVAAADVAEAHRADLATQDQYGVNYLRYWVDEEGGKIFCLVEAPSAEAASTVHRETHGLVERSSDDDYEVRSRKSWALLAYLLLSERPPARTELASLLFSEADDPLRALRWNLSEIRRALGDGVSLQGDPVVLELPPDAVVDVHVITEGEWPAAVQMPGLGSDLLEGFAVSHAAVFSTWLLSEQRRLAAATEAILHEAALGSLSHERLDEAIDYAVRATAMDPLDENHQALLIRLYRLAGDSDAAQRKYETCVELLHSELGVPPGSAVQAALHETPHGSDPAADSASIEAVLEAGTAAISAGAARAGLESLRAAVRMADAGVTVTGVRGVRSRCWRRAGSRCRRRLGLRGRRCGAASGRSAPACDFRCSFCGKDRSEVLGLVAGPKDLFICNECVDAAREVLDGHGVP